MVLVAGVEEKSEQVLVSNQLWIKSDYVLHHVALGFSSSCKAVGMKSGTERQERDDEIRQRERGG